MSDIRHSIQIATKPEILYPLVSTASGFGQWWAEDVAADGETVELGFFRRSTIYRLRLELDQPPSLAEWVCETGAEWSGTRIVFQLEASGSATVVRFTHGGWAAETDYFVNCNTTWGELMYRLKAVAEGKGRGPLFLAGDISY